MDAVRGPLRQEHCAELRTVHYQLSLHIIRTPRKRPDHRMTSYNRALKMTRCESIQTALRTRRLFVGGGALIRISGGRLCQSELCSETLRGQYGEDGSGKESGPVAYRATSGRLA